MSALTPILTLTLPLPLPLPLPLALPLTLTRRVRGQPLLHEAQVRGELRHLRHARLQEAMPQADSRALGVARGRWLGSNPNPNPNPDPSPDPNPDPNPSPSPNPNPNPNPTQVPPGAMAAMFERAVSNFPEMVPQMII